MRARERSRERSRASARAKVRGKGQAKVRAIDLGLRPEIGIETGDCVEFSCMHI